VSFVKKSHFKNVNFVKKSVKSHIEIVNFVKIHTLRMWILW